MHTLKKFWSLVAVQLLCIFKESLGEPETLSMDIRSGDSKEKRLFYSSDSFADIPDIAAKRGMELGIEYTTLCARGLFLLYQKPHYVADRDLVGSVYLLANTALTCTPLNEVGNLSSAQAITTSEFKEPHITFFGLINFMGKAMPVKDVAKGENTYPTASSIVNSLITVGQKRWTVVLSDGTKLCIQPKQSDSAICFLSNLVDNEKIFTPSGVKKVRRHCQKDEPGLIVELTECYEQGQGLVATINPKGPFGPIPEETPSPSDSDGDGVEKTPEECEVDATTDVLTEEQKNLIEARLNGTLGSGNWMEAVKSRDDIWKTEIFDKTMKIFLSVCTNQVIDPEYILLFASLYFHFWDKAIQREDADNIEFPEVHWMEINHDLDYCLETLTASPATSIAEFVAEGMKSYKQLSDVTNKIKQVLGVKPQYDYVMEINWHVANTVAGLCYAIHNNNVHFVTRFWDTYHPLYFTPIEEQWKDGKSNRLVYKYIFGGYGMEKSLAKIGFCGIAAMVEAHLLKPYPRPMEQIKSPLLNPK